jgi:hypothetical protein
MDWDMTYDPPLLLPKGLSLNPVVYSRDITDGPSSLSGVSDTEEMVPALEEDSWWYSDAVAPPSVYVGSEPLTNSSNFKPSLS